MTAWDRYLRTVEKIATTPDPSRSRTDMPRTRCEGSGVLRCCVAPSPARYGNGGLYCIRCGAMHEAAPGGAE